MTVNRDFGLAGVLGWPVAHSRSPVLHNYWIAEYGVAGRYLPLAVPPDELAAALKGLVALGFRGCNVTTPHKQAVLPFLAEVEPMARRIGAVNTVVVRADGTLAGFNNDGRGFVQSLRDEAPGWRADGGPIVVLGAGGAARAVLAALQEEGAREIRLVNRTFETAQALATEFGGGIVAERWERRDEALAGASTLVNCTNQGMVGHPPLAIALDALPCAALVADLIYTPPATPLLAAAKSRGHVVVNGLGLLLNQARPAFEAWFGVAPAISPGLRRAIAATF
ncbi:MAG: shikimate dehydrogenase [Burkholderiales bacterium]|nr:shikimate dehydrogenase [Burkholderiales bacterium]